MISIQNTSNFSQTTGIISPVVCPSLTFTDVTINRRALDTHSEVHYAEVLVERPFLEHCQTSSTSSLHSHSLHIALATIHVNYWRERPCFNAQLWGISLIMPCQYTKIEYTLKCINNCWISYLFSCPIIDTLADSIFLICPLFTLKFGQENETI